MKKAVLIGGSGKQGREYYDLLNKQFDFVAIVDSNIGLLKEIFNGNKIKTSEHLDCVLSAIDFDVAIVCLPHNVHKEITIPLIRANKMIIKEKPLAIDETELLEYEKEMNISKNYKLLTIVQRQFNNIFKQAYDHLPLLGKVYNFKYEYNLNIREQTTGWRAEYDIAKGGVLIDMGYHVLDIVLTFFGIHQNITCLKSYCYEQMKSKFLEDSASLLIKYSSGICGNINISRHHSQKNEIFEIIGSEGTMTITPSTFKLFNRNGNIIRQSNASDMSNSSSIKLDMFQQYISKSDDIDFLRQHFNHHCDIVRAISQAYGMSDNSYSNTLVA